jgi:hypothetical protein
LPLRVEHYVRTTLGTNFAGAIRDRRDGGLTTVAVDVLYMQKVWPAPIPSVGLTEVAAVNIAGAVMAAQG